jgi:DNA invertase Pin-like site-specific DNA recombinase
MKNAKPMLRRCAIYTRKSSEEGLQQNFNSLRAQREACEALIKSQASEGQRLIRTAYDDGGLSGTTMERPAIKRLLGHIRQGLIEVIVVYKVDHAGTLWSADRSANRHRKGATHGRQGPHSCC